MCVNINALIVVALILLTWRNCSFHRIIDLMIARIQTFALMISLHSKTRISHFFHSKLRTRLWKSKFSIVCIFRHLRHRLHFLRVNCKFAIVIKVQIILFTSKVLVRDSERETIFSSRSVCFEIFEFQIFPNDLLYHLLANIMIRVSQSDFEQKFENDFSCSSVYLY